MDKESGYFIQRTGPKPIESLEDETIQNIMSRHYEPKKKKGVHDTIDDPIYDQALGMSHGDAEKGLKVYQELRRTIDAMQVIDWRTSNLDDATRLIEGVVAVSRQRIEAHLQPNENGPTNLEA